MTVNLELILYLAKLLTKYLNIMKLARSPKKSKSHRLFFKKTRGDALLSKHKQMKNEAEWDRKREIQTEERIRGNSQGESEGAIRIAVHGCRGQLVHMGAIWPKMVITTNSTIFLIWGQDAWMSLAWILICNSQPCASEILALSPCPGV